MIDGFTILVAQLAAVVLLAALSGGVLGWLIGRRRRALAAVGGNGAIALNSPAVAQMSTPESAQRANEPATADTWAGDLGQAYPDSRSRSANGDEESPRVTITAPYEIEEPWTAGMATPEKSAEPSRTEFDQVLITRPETASTQIGTESAAVLTDQQANAASPAFDSSSSYGSQSHSSDSIDHSYFRPQAEETEPSSFSEEPALEQALITEPSLASGSDISQPVTAPAADVDNEDQLIDEGITSVQDPVQLTAIDASTENLAGQAPELVVAQDQPAATPVAKEQQVLDSDNPVAVEPGPEKPATTPPVTTGPAMAADTTKNTAQVELDMWNDVADIPTQLVDQSATNKEGDQSVSLDAAADSDEEDQSSRIAELERLLAKREHELSRLEAGATAAWDTTVPTLEQLIEKLRDENTALQSALGQASVVVESMQTELQILRKTRDSQARQQ